MTDPFPFPAVQPGVVAPPMDSSEKRVKKIERKVDGVANQDLSNAIVGQGSTFRATVIDGGANVLRIGKGAAAYGSRQTMTLRDIGNKISYALDELAGYGLSHPSLTYALWGVESQGPALPGAVPGTLVAQGTSYVYNPAWHIMARVRFANGPSVANATLTGTWRRVDGTTIATVSQTWLSIPANTFYVPQFERMALLAAVDMGTRVNFELRAHVHTGPDLSVQVFPIMSTGISMAFYDLLPGLH